MTQTLLPVRSVGPDAGLPVVLLHGFLADSRQWAAIAAKLVDEARTPVRVLLPDLPGHGQAARIFPQTPGWPALTALLAASLAPHLNQPALLGGYSMGGRLAASLADARLLPFCGLWLESAHPPLASDAAQARVVEDEIRAQQLADAGLSAFVKSWEALPLFASQRRLAPATQDAQRQLRLAQDARGLAQSLRWYGTGTMPQTLHVPLPVRLVAGELDAKLLARLPHWPQHVDSLDITRIADAGHAVHLERPDVVVRHLSETIDLFLRK